MAKSSRKVVLLQGKFLCLNQRLVDHMVGRILIESNYAPRLVLDVDELYDPEN